MTRQSVSRRLAPTWGAVVLAAGVLGYGVWSDHQATQDRVEATCVSLTASEKIIHGLLSLPGAGRPENAPAVRAYEIQLEDLAAARERLAGDACDV